ncbi:hypothetical protein ULMA_12360 [Patiriisocius marinus]|uniref:Uncharacterized protein n=1 Tax=Patiriisocius marinus TaxID=1397112 RepID=A0A5J4IZR7_9FLAO|nr:hypothetical protein ULMA_12360 [Patiriisocius marinus]
METNKITNYRTWSFRFLIYLILLIILVAYIVANSAYLIVESEIEGYEKYTDTNNYDSILLLILQILTSILLISGIIFTILSIRKNENKDYKYFTSIIGYSIFILSYIFSLF